VPRIRDAWWAQQTLDQLVGNAKVLRDCWQDDAWSEAALTSYLRSIKSDTLKLLDALAQGLDVRA